MSHLLPSTFQYFLSFLSRASVALLTIKEKALFLRKSLSLEAQLRARSGGGGTRCRNLSLSEP